MDPAVPRGIAKLQYAAVRLPFTLLDERLVARYWDQDRTGVTNRAPRRQASRRMSEGQRDSGGTVREIGSGQAVS